MSGDKYRSFRELEDSNRVGVDYGIRLKRRHSPVAIIAPHGGKIEPGTSEIATAIAGHDFNLYCFEGTKRRGNRDLHITSTRFDEPRCLELVKHCDIVVAIHGLRETSSRIDIGGRNYCFRDSISATVKAAGFDAGVVTEGDHAAISENNICNKGRSRTGVQLEITRALRDRLLRRDGRAAMRALATAVRCAISIESGRLAPQGVRQNPEDCQP